MEGGLPARLANRCCSVEVFLTAHSVDPMFLDRMPKNQNGVQRKVLKRLNKAETFLG